MPRVALVVNFIPPYRVPVFTELRSLVGSLRVFVSTTGEPNRAWPTAWGDLDVVVQRTLTLRRRWRHPAGFSEESYVHLPYDTLAQLWRYRPEVVISGELGVRTALAAAYKALRPDCRLLVWATLSERTEERRGYLREQVRHRLLPRADGVLVNGRSGARYVSRFGVAAERIVTVPQTTDVEAFARVPLHAEERSPRRLLYVGQLVERKGLRPFLDALVRRAGAHPQTPLELWMAGDGPLRPELERLPLPANLSLRLLGNVPYGDLPALYARAGILVFPTLADEWGLVVNEAMAAGLPVLASRYSQAVEELVTEGDTGWTFLPDRPDDVFGALDRALSTPDRELERMRRRARERAMELDPRSVAARIAAAAAGSPP